MRAALLQMNSGPDLAGNCDALIEAIAAAKDGGADMLLTPEVSNCLGASRSRQAEILHEEADDPTLSAVREAASQADLWVLIGSLALKAGGGETRFANRSFLIDSAGDIRARYDKLHMFDVVLSESESYRESSAYRPGEEALIAETPWGGVGMSICYDLRFPHLYRALAQGGASILTVPSAFARPTGRAHWETLLRARAIETGCFVLAPAQTGKHGESTSGPRATYGHSMAVAPWGDVLLDAGEAPGLHFVSLDLAEVEDARRRVPSLSHDMPFTGP